MITDNNIEAKKLSPERRKLTPLLIEKVKPSTQRARIWDTTTRLVDRYVADHLSGLKSGDQGTFLLRRFVVPKLGKVPIVGVSRADVRTLLSGVGSATTRKQVHANLSGDMIGP